jgi:hypothetical protein
MKTKLVVETILCLKNNKKVFLNGYDINTHTYPDDCPKNTIYDKKIIAYEKRYLNETSAPPVSSNIICYDNKDNKKMGTIRIQYPVKWGSFSLFPLFLILNHLSLFQFHLL